MVNYLTYKDIDKNSYDKCVEDSFNELMYAYSWYLDSVCDTWDVLVLDDYQAVMPLPIRKKFGIPYIFLPAWVQQLGIFSKRVIDQDLMLEFMQAIPKKFKLVDILLNFNNPFNNKNIVKRDNFIVPLDKPFNAIYKNFSKGRRSSIRLAKKFNLSIRTVNNINALIVLFKVNKGKLLNKPNRDYKILSDIALKGIPLGRVLIYEVLNSQGKLIGGAAFLKSNTRIVYLFSAISEEGRQKQAMSFLLDFIIQKYANQAIILDFEGSMVSEIASFYKSFGAELQPYYHYRKKQIF